MTADRLTPRNARILLGLAMAASGALLIALNAPITFLLDDWDVLLHRRGFDAEDFLDPHARHLILGPALVYKSIQATFGMEDRLPYAIAAIAFFLASVGLLWVYLRRRVGDWVALAAVLPVLVMGTAYQDLLSPFQIGYFGSMAFGIGALLAIERRDRLGDRLACALLVGSLAFAEIALAFAAGIVVALAIQRGPLRRGWVVAVPVLLYAAWYLTFGNDSEQQSAMSLHDIANSPPYILNGIATSLASLLGLGLPPELLLRGAGTSQEWGRPLLVAAVVIAAAVAIRVRRPSLLWVLVPLTVALAFWLATAANAMNAGVVRPFDASRYQYVGAVFLLMAAGDLARGWRPGWRALLATFAVAAIAALGNLTTLRDAQRGLSDASDAVRGGLAALEIADARVPPDFVLTPANSNIDYFGLVDAGPYLSATEKFGSPAYDEGELIDAPESAREAADKVLGAALPVSVSRVAAPHGGPRLSEGCTSVGGAAPDAQVVEVPQGGLVLHAAPAERTSLMLRRYASESFPVDLESVRGGARLIVPTDRSSRPWQLRIDAERPVTICPV
jgi:hypothetical protein